MELPGSLIFLLPSLKVSVVVAIKEIDVRVSIGLESAVILRSASTRIELPRGPPIRPVVPGRGISALPGL